MNWTGKVLAFPRSDWRKIQNREEFRKSGVYILMGPAENENEDLSSVYIGQAEEIGSRINNHFINKQFWDWGYAFISNGNTLTRTHILWLEYALLKKANDTGRSVLNNNILPNETAITEPDRADLEVFLNEIYRILPLIGVNIFEEPITLGGEIENDNNHPNNIDTIIVPARSDGFNEVFLGQNCWYAIRIGGGMLGRIKYIAAYQSSPVSAVTHYAPVEGIESYGNHGKYKVLFGEPATKLENLIPFDNATPGSIQGPRYTKYEKLFTSNSMSELLMNIN